jgi:hypothetical protein
VIAAFLFADEVGAEDGDCVNTNAPEDDCDAGVEPMYAYALLP